ncbi:MAG: histidine kinase [Candidatus Solibacter usitatus]|nr:histidine kinase [Candidatus Solibacter usitatus]
MLEQYLVNLFVKLAVAASLATILVRLDFIPRLLMEEERTLPKRMLLALAFAIVFGTSVAIRVLSRNGYQAVDLGLEGSLLCGLVGGYVCGLTSGILIAIPAMLNGELLTMPLFAGLGVTGGLLRDLAPEKEEMWRFSPFFDVVFVRMLRHRIDPPRVLFHVTFLFTIFFAEFVRLNLAKSFGARFLFVLYPQAESTVWLSVATYSATLFAVTLPLKVWNNTRNERKLEAQQALLTEARLAALTRQINPHFLFNTLNSVASLIRTNQEQARTMITRLSNILRRLLRKQENMSSLREELSFIDDYLAIEMVRFGSKLKFEKTVDPRTLDMLAPSMVLQPIVENSIKHGLSSKVEGGCIRFVSMPAGSRLLMIIEDDGVGIAEERLDDLFLHGIGMSNVKERLKVLYGDDYRLSVISRLGEGTRTEIEVPQLKVPLAAVS